MRARGNAHIAGLYLGAQSSQGLGSKWGIVRVQMLAVSCSIKLQFRKTKTGDVSFDLKDSDKSRIVFYPIFRSARLYYRVQGLVMMVKFIFMTAIKISKAVGNHVMKVSNLL